MGNAWSCEELCFQLRAPSWSVAVFCRFGIGSCIQPGRLRYGPDDRSPHPTQQVEGSAKEKALPIRIRSGETDLGRPDRFHSRIDNRKRAGSIRSGRLIEPPLQSGLLLEALCEPPPGAFQNTERTLQCRFAELRGFVVSHVSATPPGPKARVRRRCEPLSAPRQWRMGSTSSGLTTPIWEARACFTTNV
jgi:hypothetical protein